MKLLADTSALLALYLVQERDHEKATSFLHRRPEARLVLTELILAELATRIRARAGAERAVDAADKILRSRRYDLVFADIDLISGALIKMARFSDKRLSLTDCVSFELMEKLGLPAAFTFDRDFRDCGFETVP
ncbi:MAG TPA: PIN domain-containing protein [Thermoanaerobaculia bacterium]|jgi:predicted nucleic acid-binding protein|nr:PIN domain-containing protein [Thermoanaerobaculia bacterium]